MDIQELKNILSKYGLKPRKYLGQNFLVDESVLQEIINVSTVKKTDTVLEIGPGLGVLTMELSQKVKKVITIEKDEKLAELLNEQLQANNIKNVTVIKKDALKFNPANHNLKPSAYKLIANIPYYITSPLIRKFLTLRQTQGKRPKLMVLMVQKEVAERICATPPNMSILSIAVQAYASPQIMKIVKKESFWPSPKVDSAILRITPSQKNIFTEINEEKFFNIVKTGFSSPRKQLKNNLKNLLGNNAKLIFKKIKIDPSRRAETLSIGEWISLVKNIDL
jgi:16S rRNA (adenine1518-N6/adenine1519-N6)-dimethyltransferase